MAQLNLTSKAVETQAQELIKYLERQGWAVTPSALGFIIGWIDQRLAAQYLNTILSTLWDEKDVIIDQLQKLNMAERKQK